jgi:hypothetical protein
MSKFRVSIECDSVEEALSIINKVGSSGGSAASPAPAAQSTTETPPAAAAKKGPGRPRKEAAAEEKPGAQSAPAAKEPVAEPTKHTQESVRAKLNAVVEKKGAKAGKELLTKYAQSISALKPDDYAKVIADCAAALGESTESAEEDTDFLG